MSYISDEYRINAVGSININNNYPSWADIEFLDRLAMSDSQVVGQKVLDSAVRTVMSGELPPYMKCRQSEAEQDPKLNEEVLIRYERLATLWRLNYPEETQKRGRKQDIHSTPTQMPTIFLETWGEQIQSYLESSSFDLNFSIEFLYENLLHITTLEDECPKFKGSIDNLFVKIFDSNLGSEGYLGHYLFVDVFREYLYRLEPKQRESFIKRFSYTYKKISGLDLDEFVSEQLAADGRKDPVSRDDKGNLVGKSKAAFNPFAMQLYNIKYLESRNEGSVNRLREDFGIKNFHRYTGAPIFILEEQAGKPIEEVNRDLNCVVFCAYHDWNGAFDSFDSRFNSNYWDLERPRGSTVLYEFEDFNRGVLDPLVSIAEGKEMDSDFRPIDDIVVMVHAGPDSISTGTNVKFSQYTISDLNRVNSSDWTEIDAVLNEGCRWTHISCSVAGYRRWTDILSSKLAVKVIGATIPVSTEFQLNSQMPLVVNREPRRSKIRSLLSGSGSPVKDDPKRVIKTFIGGVDADHFPEPEPGWDADIDK